MGKETFNPSASFPVQRPPRFEPLYGQPLPDPVDDSDSDDEIQFKANRYKNQHSQFYESLKQNVRSESYENLNGALSAADIETIASEVESQVNKSPIKRSDTKKMRDLLEKKRRSQVRRLKQEILESPEREHEVIESFKRQHIGTPVRDEDLRQSVEKNFDSPYSKHRTERKISKHSLDRNLESFNNIFGRENSSYNKYRKMREASEDRSRSREDGSVSRLTYDPTEAITITR